MNEVAHLIAVADAYLLATGMKDVTLSFRVFNDSKKLSAMRAGADITVGKFNAALRWFSTNWPTEADWPSCIERPRPLPEAAE